MTRADLRLALEAADAADAITLALYRSSALRIETKQDLTPVTEADQGAERAIRQVLETARPQDAIAGEEYGETGSAKRRWIIDPIDATVNYMRGVPVWGTLIALEDPDGIAVGVVSSPALGHRWWAGRGLGAFRNASPMRVSTVDSLDDATLSFNSIVDHEEHGFGEQVTALSRSCGRTRGYGDFLSFMLLADGAVDVVTEPIAKEWDLAPLDIIVTEAGGTFTDVQGEHTVRGGNAIATNGLLHDEVLAMMRCPSPAS
jgi:histidinol-phosphatase